MVAQTPLNPWPSTGSPGRVNCGVQVDVGLICSTSQGLALLSHRHLKLSTSQSVVSCPQDGLMMLPSTLVVFRYPTRAAHPALPVPRFGARTLHCHLTRLDTTLSPHAEVWTLLLGNRGCP